MVVGSRCCVVGWAEGERLLTARAPWEVEQRGLWERKTRNVGLDVWVNLQAVTIRAALSED